MHIKIFIVVLIIILLVVGTIYMFNKKENIIKDEAPLAAGMNFDLEEIQPFLNRLSSSVLDSGFTAEEITTIEAQIEKMNKDNEIKEIGTFDVIYKGDKSEIRIEAEIHIEDDSREVVLLMYTSPELIEIIDEEMMKHAEEIGA
ncbi:MULTISPECIES: hypothetical protein [Bacillaceae]|uniref:hypothetical protein n=1 Tax=Bacillaceae TaxID=186817 RepID=UPI00095704B2|nr:hypothetical protein [Priestia flexa]MBY6087914.1 hypothetical protein [Priestia flexa]SIR48667.1 hypothetical protein SAMN05880580_12515 [Priestia flexa]